MTHSYGYRAKTRKKFARGFKQHNPIRMKAYLTTYKVGDYVDVLVDGSQHKGMPHKLYHGRTAKVFNVNPRSVGLLMWKKSKRKICIKKSPC